MLRSTRKLCTAITLILLSATGCQTAADSHSGSSLNAINEIKAQQALILPELNSIREELAVLQSSRNADMALLNEKIDRAHNSGKELAEVNRNINSLRSTINSQLNKGAEPQKEGKAMNSDNTKLADGKMIFGEVEWIYIGEADASLEGRIDTGAAVSSISAVNAEKFERDGKTWYRFGIPLTNENYIVVEAPWVRNIQIRQASTNGVIEERPVVRLTVKVDSHTGKAEFSLKDRTTMAYPVLIGREFIKDIAVVDVSRHHIQKRIEAGTVFTNYQDTTNKNLQKKEVKKEEIPAIPAAPEKVSAPANEAKPAK